MTLYNLFFSDNTYNKDRRSAMFIITRLESKIKILEEILNPQDDVLDNINNKKLIVKVLKYQFDL